MNILVACEYSGRVREAFRARGHNAWSCDLLPDENDSEWHLQGDVVPLLDGVPSKRGTFSHRWDMIIAFPPCTNLSVAGANLWQTKANDGRMAEGMALFMRIALADCLRIAIENPVGVMGKAWQKADQTIEPYWFGEPWQKRTQLWLKNLPPLKPSNMVEPKGNWVSGGSTYRGLSNEEKARIQRPEDGLSRKQRAHVRNKTFQGVANAMAEQWG